MLNGLSEYCTEVLAEHGCPSASVAVADHGRVVFAAAYGTADLATGRPATPETVYALASVTKPMTATAVCHAADDGLLDLDASVPLPGADRRPAPTVRQLLQHRGGLGPYYDWDYGGGERVHDPDRYTLPTRPPGTGFGYANLGYRLLGRLLEQATGQDLGAAVRTRVFEPLGLTACHLGRVHPGPAPSARRYTPDGRAYPDYDCSHPGATLGWAPAGELALFAQSYDRLLKPETATAVRHALPVNEHLGYGLGWCLSSGDGPLVQSHGGGGPGVATMAVALPERMLSVAVLTNSTNKAARDAILRHVLGELAPDWTPESITPVIADPPRRMTLPEGDWTGRISAPEREVPLALRVLPDGQVALRLDGAPATAPASASAAWDLRASFPLQLPTADARINSPELGLALRLAGGALTGEAHAYKNGDAEGRLGNFLSHPCTLTPA
ncbi:serine hydrolase domain-containing protein [Streptomyces tubercidicus]|uniref:serine hydrolase domain-containing protein n=1 Tax=Streptomyces tubercidicus TaxID=47759 RepID=UPI002E0F6889|nr:beta-lactamase family protein [Streptomyces tubercidicus]WSX24826.1 beta-lactamase family protein [Streptomyces tubercidicus]